MLEKLKRSGNPYYQFHEDLNTYEERCKITDPEGHQVIFDSDDALEQDIDLMPTKTTHKVILMKYAT